MLIDLARSIHLVHGAGPAARYLCARGVTLGTALRVMRGQRLRERNANAARDAEQ